MTAATSKDQQNEDDRNSSSSLSLSSATPIRFSVTGAAAHLRLKPLVPASWKDITQGLSSSSSSTDDCQQQPDFLWENAPRSNTKPFRDSVRCYSHLPNGTALLDSKWVLARLFSSNTFAAAFCGGGGDSSSSLHDAPCTQQNNPAVIATCHNSLLATLETHCFRGKSGYDRFSKHVDLSRTQTNGYCRHETNDETPPPTPIFPDLLSSGTDLFQGISSITTNWESIASKLNMWVVKDASSNGAGGIWVVGPNTNASKQKETIVEEHKYVAQKYVWPMVLFGGRKCHVRVYALMTSDQRAFVHRRAFLHVANSHFTMDQLEENSIHITNCCANSHDSSKFAGEICADLLMKRGEEEEEIGDDHEKKEVIALGDFFPSIRATVATLAQRAFPFVDGGQANGGFEYLGLDFVLSWDNSCTPLAYLLEVNAPPSQDTATGLPHAEALHDAVVGDILKLWVLPRVLNEEEKPGGWQCVYQSYDQENMLKLSIPSKAAMLNRMKWALFEQKAMRQDEQIYGVEAKTIGVSAAPQRVQSENTDCLAKKARNHFSYFSSSAANQHIFMESAGGSQVPMQVVDRVKASLQNRNRVLVGKQSQQNAYLALHELLGASIRTFDICLGANATTLLALVASSLKSHVTRQDEIVVAVENHMAHVTPWLNLARECGATVKWWNVKGDGVTSNKFMSSRVEDLVTKSTKIVAVSHSSNVLGESRDVAALSKIVRQQSTEALLVVDGVATVPHMLVNLDDLDIDLYVISCHKVFGPHLGALVARKSICENLGLVRNSIETGTVNYEACEGIVGLLEYMKSWNFPEMSLKQSYHLIRTIEMTLTKRLLEGLAKSSLVTVLGTKLQDNTDWGMRLPVVSIVHKTLSSSAIEDSCLSAGFSCRSGIFLSTDLFLQQFGVAKDNGMVRFSLAHYNTTQEVDQLIDHLHSIPGWFSS